MEFKREKVIVIKNPTTGKDELLDLSTGGRCPNPQCPKVKNWYSGGCVGATLTVLPKHHKLQEWLLGFWNQFKDVIAVIVKLIEMIKFVFYNIR